MGDSLLRDLHQVLAWSFVIGNGVVGLWASVAHFQPVLKHRSLWWLTGLVQVLVLVHVSVGVALMRSEDLEPPDLHLLYGFVGLMTVGIVYSYRHQLSDRLHLLYGGGSLFIMGLGIRAVLLSPV